MTDGVMNRSEGRDVFGRDAAGYDVARLGYPAELYDAIAARSGGSFAGLSVLEIGPGTGLVTRELMARGVGRLVAVESDPALARQLSGFVGGDERLDVINAPFEDAALGPGRFDVVCAAAAFHWLDIAPSLAKVHAALASGGTLALWWNSYRNPHHGDPFAAAVVPLLAGLRFPPFQSADQHGSLDEAYWRGELTGAGFGSIEHRLIRNERTLTTAEARALFATYSFIRLLDAPQRERLLDAIASVADRQFGGVVPNVVLTASYICTAISSRPRGGAL